MMTTPHPVSGDNSGEEGASVGRKRMRVSRACDTCRRRKERCDGAQPSCQRCSSVGRTCSYNPTRKRGLRAGYVRATEILLGLLLSSYDRAEDLVLAVLQGEEQIPGRQSSCHHQLTPAPSLLGQWRKSSALEELRKHLFASETEEDEDSYVDSLDQRLTSIFNKLSHQDKPNSPPENDHPILELDLVPGPHRVSRIHPVSSTIQSNAVPLSLNGPLMSSETSLPPNWPRLLDVYLQQTHCWFPVSEKHALFRSANHLAGSAGISCTDLESSGQAASTWAVLACGSYQLIAMQTAGVCSPESGVSQAGADQMFAKAKALALQDDCLEPGHIHALLVLSLIELAFGSWSKAWLFVGRAIQVAIAINVIPQSRSSSTIPKDDSAKRLFLGCFILDTLEASALDVRPYLSRNDLRSIGSIAIDGLEEWETWRPLQDGDIGVCFVFGPGRALSTFDTLGYLVGLMNDALRLTDTGSYLDQMPALIDDLCQRIATLNTSLPISTYGGGPQIGDFEPPHMTHLKIAAACIYARFTTDLEKARGSAFSHNAAHVPEILDSTLSFLRSTPKHSTIMKPLGAPPTLNVFLGFLARSQHPSSENYLQDYSTKTQSGNATGLEPWTNMDRQGFNGRRESSLGVQVDIEAPPPPVRLDMAFGTSAVNLSQDTAQQTSGKVSDQACIAGNNNAPVILMTTPPISTQSVGASDTTMGISLSDHVADTTDSISSVPDQEGLFNQLSFLDATEWPVMLGDFMERLGLPRDGDVSDFQNLMP